MKKTITIGSRGSDLALKQVDLTKAALLGVNPALDIAVRVIKTEGDINSSPIPLDVVGKGWFTKEIERELQQGTIDIAVHSLKDVSEVMPEGLVIAAYLKREDPRDVLVSKNNIPFLSLPKGAIIGTDSSRRRVQLLALRDDVVVQSVRGNVLTRLKKLETEPYDALVLAAAGLKRLGLEERITEYFHTCDMLPAPGQGVLAIQIRASDTELAALVAATADRDTTTLVEAERSFSRHVGGGCKQPTAAYATLQNDVLFLEGVIARANGAGLVRDTVHGPRAEAATLGEALAKRMLRA